METLKRKMVLAESKSVYVQKSCYSTSKVSMVVPVYNAENYIARCINTILAQLQADVEIVVVDGRSTDCTPEMIDWYVEK